MNDDGVFGLFVFVVCKGMVEGLGFELVEWFRCFFNLRFF